MGQSESWFRKNKLKKVSALLLLTLALWGVYVLVQQVPSSQCLSIRASVLAWGPLAPYYFLGLYLLLTAGLTRGYIMRMMAGMIFGALWGPVLALSGATISSTLVFLLARYGMRDRVTARLTRKAWFATFHKRMEKGGFYYLLFLRAIPILPFGAVNLGAGILPLPLHHFLAATLIGMGPGSWAYATIGAAGCEIIDPLVRGDLSLMELPAGPRNFLLLAVSVLALLSLLPLVWQRYQGRKQVNTDSGQ